MNGKPQTLSSKFKISYNLLLNLIDIGDKDLVQFAKKSMVTSDIDNQAKEINDKIALLNAELNNIKQCCSSLRTPINVIEEFSTLHDTRANAVNKKRKDIDRKIQQINDNYKYVEQDKQTYQKIATKGKEIKEYQYQLEETNKYIYSGVEAVLNHLKSEHFVENDDNELNLTLKGKIASQLREIHCLVFSEIIEKKSINELSSKQLVGLFSCFTNVSVADDYKEHFPYTDDKKTNETVTHVSTMYSDYQEKEIDLGINTGTDYNFHFDLLRYTTEWCEAQTVEECKLLLQKIAEEKGIFLGEFVKALLKINNISNEMEKIAELTGNIHFLSKLREIPNMTLKYVVTNQSLYV